MRSVIVASGKGGTGKTTMTAALAHIAAQTCAVALADCDVEASNLPLALEVGEVTCESFEGGFVASIDDSECIACGACRPICRFDAIQEGTSYTVDELSCEGCGRCVSACPTGAIEMHQRSVGSACTGLSAIGPVAYGQLSPGQDLSGRLVTEVRRRAAVVAEERGCDLLLIDGPPGVGCPLMAALSSTDLLVAVAEPSVSGVNDLKRLAELSVQMKVPMVVVLNKADLSEQGAAHVRETCASLGLLLVAEVPFELGLARYLIRLADGRASTDLLQSPVGQRLAEAWESIEKELQWSPSSLR